VPYALGAGKEPLDMLDIKLMNYLDIIPAIPAGTVYVGWSDLLLFFDTQGIDFTKRGFSVFAHPGDVAYGVAHAAFVVGDDAAKRSISRNEAGTYPCKVSGL
jgi:hypothetical protein